MTPQQLAILNSLVTFAAEHIPGGLSLDERPVAQIVGQWALEGKITSECKGELKVSSDGNTHYTPRYYGIDPACTVCQVPILDDEDWEGDNHRGAQHRIPPVGCVKAVAREVLVLKEGA